MSAPPRRGIHLRYTFEELGQEQAAIENPLFDLLAALQQEGSISAAARVLDLSYRHVWGALRRWEETLGRPLVDWAQGRNARLTPFAHRLMWAERQARVRMTPHVEALRAELGRVFAMAEDASLELLPISASHDLGLPHLLRIAEEQSGLHMQLRFVGSEEALRELNDGRCRVAGFHVPRLAGPSTTIAEALRPLLSPGTHKLIGSHWRRQGLMWRPGEAAPDGLAALASGRWRFVNRQPTSGTRLLADHLLHEARIDPASIEGYRSRVEYTHVAVAAAIASGVADVGIGIEAVAVQFGLPFLPLADEDYYLVCLKPDLDVPAMAALREVLASEAWAAALAPLTGYGVQQPGEVLSLTRALPWWRYAQPKQTGR